MLRIQAVNFVPTRTAQNKSNTNVQKQNNLLNSTNQGDTVSFNGKTKRFMKVTGEIVQEIESKVKKGKSSRKRITDPFAQQNHRSLDKRIRHQEAGKMKREERAFFERFDDEEFEEGYLF